MLQDSPIEVLPRLIDKLTFHVSRSSMAALTLERRKASGRSFRIGSLGFSCSMGIVLAAAAFGQQHRSKQRIDSKQLVDQFTSGSISVASVETLFRAQGRQEGDVIYLHPQVEQVDQVVIALSTAASGSQVPKSVQIDFKRPYQVSPEALRPAACSHWKISPLARAENPHAYFCYVNRGGQGLLVTEDLTGLYTAPGTRVIELSFTR